MHTIAICWLLPRNQSFIDKLPATRGKWVIIGYHATCMQTEHHNVVLLIIITSNHKINVNYDTCICRIKKQMNKAHQYLQTKHTSTTQS